MPGTVEGNHPGGECRPGPMAHIGRTIGEEGVVNLNMCIISSTIKKIMSPQMNISTITLFLLSKNHRIKSKKNFYHEAIWSPNFISLFQLHICNLISFLPPYRIVFEFKYLGQSLLFKFCKILTFLVSEDHLNISHAPLQ
jgi:hypothetical protein